MFGGEHVPDRHRAFDSVTVALGRHDRREREWALQQCVHRLPCLLRVPVQQIAELLDAAACLLFESLDLHVHDGGRRALSIDPGLESEDSALLLGDGLDDGVRFFIRRGEGDGQTIDVALKSRRCGRNLRPVIESETGELWAKVFVIGDSAVDHVLGIEWPPEADLHQAGPVEGQEPGWRSVAFSVSVPVVLEGKPLIMWFVTYQLGLFGARTEEIRQAAHGFDALLITHKDDESGRIDRATTLIEQITQFPSPVQGLQQVPSRLVWLDAEPNHAGPPGFELLVETGLPVAHICDDSDWWSLANQLGHELAARR